MLSALVVKASFFLIVRLWFDVMPGLATPGGDNGARPRSAPRRILFGSVLALRQARLKLLVAYSTVAQIGYLFLMFPLAVAGGDPWSAEAWNGGVLQTVSHAFAKAAMFMAAGLVAERARPRPASPSSAGIRPGDADDRLRLRASAALSLMGLPPSGGFAAKWLLLQASVESGQWAWAVIMLVGGLLAGGYVYRVIAPALADAPASLVKMPASRRREAVALALALGAVLLGFAPEEFSSLLQIGQPLAMVALQ